MAVIVIIAILATLTVGATRYAWRKAASSRAQAEIATMEAALEAYKIDKGIYPSSTATRDSGSNQVAGAIERSNSGSLYTALAGGPKKYFSFKPDQILIVGSTTNVLDPFRSPYNYYRGSGQRNAAASFDLWSYGPDGRNDTEDDIVNWGR